MSVTNEIVSHTTHESKAQAYRLPANVSPTHYALALKTDLEELDFAAESVIHLTVNAPTRCVVLNFSPADGIKHWMLTNVATGEKQGYEALDLFKEGGSHGGKDMASGEAASTHDSRKIGAGQWSANEESQRVTLCLPASWKLEKGSKIILHASWSKELSDSMIGYYKASWQEDGQEKHYALTQFQATSARLAFPAWDEPALKCTYSIAMVSRKGLVNLSNMPVIEERKWTGTVTLEGESLGETFSQLPGEEWIVTKFQTTPLISSYLVAWATGDFAHLESGYVSPISAQLALNVKAKVMPLYEQIFDVEYALPKLDTLVVSSFDAGAMENRGLIIGRTTAFPWDPLTSSLAAKKRVIDVQSHECAHMWFGNVVSPEWWTHLWLNEAFATLMGEVIVPDRVFPEFKARQEFLTVHLARALNLDSIRSSHPIEVECQDANAVRQIFDSISYSKGAAVLRMLATLVGEDKFLDGVSIYLKDKLFGNAITEDLWRGISAASGMDVGKIMKEWTSKIGFPVLTVEELGNVIKIRQNRFLATGDVQDEDDETIWYIPLGLKTIDENGSVTIDHKAILQEREAALYVGGAKSFKLNAETVGLYRVAYTPERLAMLGEEAAKKDSAFSTEDRIGLVSDVVTLACAGYSKISSALNFISKLSKEQELRVWNSIAMSLSKLKEVWWQEPETITAAIDKLRVSLFRPLADRLGWNFEKSEDPATTELRVLAIATLAGAEDPGTISEILKRFQPFLDSDNDSQIPTDIQRTIFAVAVHHGGNAEYQKVREIYDKPPNPVAKLNALNALGATKDKRSLSQTFKMVTDGSVLDQDIVFVFNALSSNWLTRKEVVRYFKDNYTELERRFHDNFGMRRLISVIFGQLTSREDLEDTQAFFKDKNTAKYDSVLQQAMDNISASVGWIERDREDVAEWLRDNQFLLYSS